MMPKLLALLLLPASALAGSANVTFDYVQTIPLASCRIYSGSVGGTNAPMLFVLPPGSTSITNRLTNLVAGVTNWVYATVVSAGRVESDPSNLLLVVAPFAPVASIPVVSLAPVWVPSTGGVIQVSRDLETWRERIDLQSTNGGLNITVVLVPDQPQLFLRLKP